MLDNLTRFLYQIATFIAQKADAPEKGTTDKLTDLFGKVFDFIKALASNFVDDLDKLPLKGGLEWLIVAVLISLVLLALSSGLSSFLRATGDFLKNVAQWLRLVSFIGTIVVIFFILLYWVFFSQRDCFSKNPEFEPKWTNCKINPPKEIPSSKGKK